MKSSYVVGDRVRFVADTFSSARYGLGGYVVAVTTDRVTATIEVQTDGGRVLKFGEAQAARLLELAPRVTSDEDQANSRGGY